MPRALLHPADFTSPHRYEEELARIFERSWVHVADLTDVPGPGDYVPGAIGRTPVLVMRGDDGVVRGFLNACPHRGATLAEARGPVRQAAPLPLPRLDVRRRRRAAWRAVPRGARCRPRGA